MPQGDPRLKAQNEFQNLIGNRVKERRIFLNLSREELNDKIIEVTQGEWVPRPQLVQAIEIGRRRVYDTEVIAFAKALAVSPQWLLMGDLEKASDESSS